MMRAILLGLVLCTATVASANTFTFAARVDDGAAAADGLFTIEAALLASNNAVIWSEQQTNVIVIDGVLALDIGAAEPLPATVPAGARLRLTIDDDELDPIPLASLLDVDRAGSATSAASATRATSLNGVDATAAATREALVAPGGLPVAFGNITGLSPTVLDGDNGTTVTSTSTDLNISNRTLGLHAVSGSRLAPGAVTGARVSGTLGTDQVADGTITAAKLADGTLPRSRLAANPTEREVKTAAVWLIPSGCHDAGYFTDAGFCIMRTCTLSGGGTGYVGCDDTGCFAPVGPLGLQSRCNLSLLEDPTGDLVLE